MSTSSENDNGLDGGSINSFSSSISIGSSPLQPHSVDGEKLPSSALESMPRRSRYCLCSKWIFLHVIIAVLSEFWWYHTCGSLGRRRKPDRGRHLMQQLSTKFSAPSRFLKIVWTLKMIWLFLSCYWLSYPEAIIVLIFTCAILGGTWERQLRKGFRFSVLDTPMFRSKHLGIAS